mmetsp:Transcript_61242/g.70181  ORF Transcript_61242/g.70181 Transcript_61242/m.70181 type:complete len:135 (+) Transcript_61242:2550-2954(+)
MDQSSLQQIDISHPLTIQQTRDLVLPLLKQNVNDSHRRKLNSLGICCQFDQNYPGKDQTVEAMRASVGYFPLLPKGKCYLREEGSSYWNTEIKVKFTFLDEETGKVQNRSRLGTLVGEESSKSSASSDTSLQNR